MAKKIEAGTIVGNITRTFYDVYATAYVVTGVKDGVPIMEEVVSDVYVTVNPNNTTEAYRNVKAVNKSAIKETVSTIVLGEQLRTMSLSDFYFNSDVVRN